jgi:deoxyribonuclease IV
MLKNRVGVHIRMRSSLHELMARADSLDLPFFQCFFVPQDSGKLIRVSQNDVHEFLQFCHSRFARLFCHVSYWVNLASLINNGFTQLLREITFAKRLEFSHFVLHAGTAKGALDRMQGIDALARGLNLLFSREQEGIILLENSAHGKLAIGSDISDFKLLLEKVDKPERINFCIDTAHAYSFGYDIVREQEKFIDLLDTTIGVERIKLIHLNDTVEQLGSRIDRHGIIGSGNIGEDALKQFVMHPQLQHIPVLLELPDMPVEDELVVLNRVRGW